MPSVDTLLPAGSLTTFRQTDGPERTSLNEHVNRQLDEFTRVEPADFEYLWSLCQHELADSQLPPTPWCDDEFRSVLDELLLPEGGSPASDWSVHVHGGFVPSSPDGMGGARSWESSTVIAFGLSLDGPARFRADLVQLMYPQDASDDASAGGFEGDFPVFYSTISVSMEWSSLGQFWEYPLAYDLIDLVVAAPPDMSGWGGVALPTYGGFEDASVVSNVSYVESADPLMLLGEFKPQTAIGTGTDNASQPPMTHVSSVSSDPHRITTHSWSVISGPPKSQVGSDSAVNPISEAQWDHNNGVLEFGPQGLGFEPSLLSGSLEVETPSFSKGRFPELEDDRSLSGKELLSATDENELHSPGSTSFVEDATCAGFQRLLASDLDSEASTTGLVDLGMLAGMEMIVLPTGTAHSAVARNSTSPVERDEAFGDGRRTRVQEFVLTATANGPDCCTSEETIGASADAGNVTENGPPETTPPDAGSIGPQAPDDPVSQVEAPVSPKGRASFEHDLQDDNRARLHDAALSSLTYSGRASCESASAILACVLGQVVLCSERLPARDRSGVERGPRIRA